jgi:peptide/nickel transport system substrate-binding protein
MYRKTLVIALISMLLLSAIPIAAFAAQPPVDPNTLIFGDVGMPGRSDPATHYDTASGQLIMQVYEPLIDMYREFTTYTSPPAVEQGKNDQFVPRLAEAIGPPDAVWPEGKAVQTEVIIMNIHNIEPVDINDPTCTHWESYPIGGRWFHINGWRNNNPVPPGLGFCDVIYMEELVGPSGPWIPCTKFGWHVEAVVDLGGGQYVITVKRTWYIFKLRQGVKIHPWKMYNGAYAPAANLTTADVEYYFERAMTTDRLYGPTWMFYKPMLDMMSLDDPWFGGWDLHNVQDLTDLAHLIDCAIQENGTCIKINMCIDFPEIAFLQILTQTWAYIVPKDFAVDHGCWDGNFFNATNYPVWIYYRRGGYDNLFPTNSRSPLDRAPTILAPTGYVNRVPPLGWTGSWAGHADPAPTSRGTGPYTLTVMSTTLNNYWRVDAFDPCYWRGWVTGTDPHRYYVKTIIDRNIAEWTTRKLAFLAGDVDTCAVPRAYMFDLLTESPPGSGNWVPLPGIICQTDIPTLQSDSAHFQIKGVAAGSPYMPTIGGVNQSLFFANVYARKAFAYALDFTSYVNDAWFGEAYAPPTWCIANLAPDYRDPSIVHYDLNYDQIVYNLKNANFSGTPLWTSGFKIHLVYNEGNDQRKIACDMIEYAMEHIPVSYGAHGTFDVTVLQGEPWSIYLGEVEEAMFPFWFIGWLADFADVDNWARPYMHTYGDFSSIQGYSNTTVDILIDLGVKTSDADNVTRRNMYYDLQHTFINECPTLMLVQPYGRAWYRNWYQGWYYNNIYPGVPCYDRWKGFLADFNRDMKVNILDLVKLAGKFGKTVPPEDPIYDLDGNGKINILDLVKCATMFGAGVP